MMSIAHKRTGFPRGLRLIDFDTFSCQVICLLLFGGGCSWQVDLDNLATRGRFADASSSPDVGRDAASVERMGRESYLAAADLIEVLGEPRSDSSNESESDARDSIASSESNSDLVEEDVLAQGDQAFGAVIDTRPDTTVDDGPDSGAVDTHNPEDGLAPDALPTTTAPTCSVFPTANATLMLSSTLSAVTGCGYPGSTVPPIYAAVDPKTFSSSAACGVCILIQTAAATVEALVTDLGPTLQAGNPTAIAVSKRGMDLLVPDGSIYVTEDVQWKATACTLRSSAMSFTFEKGSNAYYAGLLVQNHRYGLAKVEYKTRSTYNPLLRMPYNFWVAPLGMGSGPFTLRLTDQLGQIVEQSGIPLVPGETFNGESQFPLCSAN